jgi:hypothetical protein
MTKITDLPQTTFNADIIDNCFFVDKINTRQMSAVKLKSVFDEIIKRASESGLTVELQSDKIVFIHPKK